MTLLRYYAAVCCALAATCFLILFVSRPYFAARGWLWGWAAALMVIASAFAVDLCVALGP